MTEPIKLPPFLDHWFPLEDAEWKRLQQYATEAIEADRQARGEPVAQTYKDSTEFHVKASLPELAAWQRGWNECEELFYQQESEPVYAFRRKGLTDFCTCTKERFDELSDNKLFDTRIFYTTPQPQQQGSEPVAYISGWHNGYLTLKMLDPSFLPHDNMALYAKPQPQQIPEGYKLVPIDPTERMLQAAYNAVESEGLVTTTWLRNAIYRAMLEAAPQPKGES